MDKHLLIGSPTIDQQHRALMTSFQRLSSAKVEDALSDALSRISQQIRHHFYTEEALMDGLLMPLAEKQAHLAAHHQILEELANLHLDAMDGKVTPLPEMISMVTGWVVQHLVDFDLSMKPYFAGTTFE